MIDLWNVGSIAIVIAIFSLAAVGLLTARRMRIDEEVNGPTVKPGAKKPARGIRAYAEKAAHELEGSGIKLSARELCALWASAVTIPPLAAAVLGAPLAAIAALAALGALAPALAISATKRRNERRFEEMLGQTMPLIASNLRGGMALRQAIMPVAQDMDEPIRSEFAQLSRDINRGVPVADAIETMAERNRNRDLKLFSSAVRAQQQTGGNLADIVDQVGATIRERVALRMEVRSKTSQGRATMWIMAAVPPALLAALWAMNDMYAEYYTGPAGPITLVCCGLLEALGVIVAQKICKIETD